MPFQPGNQCAKNRTTPKPYSDALRYIGAQPYLPGKVAQVRLPRKATNLQKMAAVLFERGFAGDVVAIKEIGDRTEGKVAQAIIGGDEDAPPIKTRETSMRELARVIGSILVQGAKEAQEAAE